MSQNKKHTNNALKLVSFNCKSVKRSVENVRSLCITADVVALQETWLLPHDLTYLSTVHDDFEWTGTSAVDTSVGILHGRPYGGVALLWRKSIFSSVCVVNCVSTRLCAVKCQIREYIMLFFSVYMPVDCPENITEFTECLSEMNAIIEDCNANIVFMLGDFNAHPNELFFNELTHFCKEQYWACVDYEMLSCSNPNTYTYTSDINGSSRWLDHCLVTRLTRNYIKSINILNDVSWSDHYPLEVICTLNIPILLENSLQLKA